ncbi:MAG: sigma-54-dependent Fis family transcriptional regulator [Desulfarculus sp.]|jgi:DNA-binding NtrC family response regulator|nr:MAG: sigma-54-dependent Fis family transcriptional regulator [Desulfarculus sp.]
MIVCRDPEAIATIQGCFPGGYRVRLAQSKEQCLNAAESGPAQAPDFIFLDLEALGHSASVGRFDYREALEPFKEKFPAAETIIMGPPESIRQLVMAVKAGASNYLTYPLDPSEVAFVREGLEEERLRQSELDYLRSYFLPLDLQEVVRTNSPALRRVLDQLRSVAPTRSTVLLTGETGTGKGVLARVIHQLSKRARQAFISVHCGAIPDNLVESELFGHEKGSFTGAVKRKLGKFEIAKGGTIFLDEVGTLTPAAQIKMLQVLQERTFQRVGGVETIEADVRIIAASNYDLKELCEQGQFRRDLYYRLNVFPLHTPPLCERIEDIPLLVYTFLGRLNLLYGKQITQLAPEVSEAFRNYSWPGNIRELENLIERAYILEDGPVLSVDSFPGELFTFQGSLGNGHEGSPPKLAEARRQGVELIEREYLHDLLTQNQGRIDRTARAAGITPRQLHKMMTKYGIRKESFK